MRYATVALALLMTLSVAAQSPPRLAFEVTSVKPSSPSAERSAIQPAPGQFRALNMPLAQIIMFAFRVRDYQLVGGPAWLQSERYDMIGTHPGTAAQGRESEMVQGALEDRFKLKTHRETREGPLFTLLPARSNGQLGPKLQRSPVDCATLTASGVKAGKSPAFLGPPCNVFQFVNGSDMIMRGKNRTLAQMAVMLSARVGRTVVDRTGIQGEFDWELTWTVSFDVNSGKRDEAVSLSTAIQEQLGLKLEPGRGPMDVIVIDSVQRPTPD